MQVRQDPSQSRILGFDSDTALQVMEMEAARTFLAVSPPQIGLEACPPKGWEKEREILQLQAELEAANAMVQALEGVSDGGPTASQHVPQYVPVAEPRVEEKVVYKYVQVEYEVIQERTREEPRLTTVDTLRNKLVEVEKPVYQTKVVEVERPVPVKPAEGGLLKLCTTQGSRGSSATVLLCCPPSMGKCLEGRPSTQPPTPCMKLRPRQQRQRRARR